MLNRKYTEKVGSGNKTCVKTLQFTLNSVTILPSLVLSLYDIWLFVAFFFTTFECHLENVMCALYIKGAILHHL